jgi:flavin reductase (DIM6/NTAB) family NADH-FMN oxidoreductase RutF
MNMAAADAHYYEPANGHGLKHDPFNAIVGPRPIGWVSTVDAEGRRNLAPYSFFNAFNYHPPLVGFSSIGWKDSVANVSQTGEFVWNLATRDLAERMNMTSAHVGQAIDEFALSGLTPAPSRLVRPARVAESPVNFECRLSQLIQLQGSDGALAQTWLVIGEVMAVHIDPALIRDGVYDTAAARPILRAGRMGDYAEITPEAMFEMARPDAGPPAPRG